MTRDTEGQLPEGMTPQDAVALDFMLHKGLDHLKPVNVRETVPAQEWVYMYVLRGGAKLYLLIQWKPDEQEWDCVVKDFRS